MKILKEEIIFNCAAESLWDILSDVSRCDWVPTIDQMILEGDCRVFEMEGMGKVKEQILLLDNDAMRLQYSAIETRTPLDHHLATMQISSIDADSCKFLWTTEIEPEIFADAIHQGMLISIDGLKKVLFK
ncbi:SRPBCC family protein [Gammaproteobacteria bacterium]|nr:SRPBCC family protein [Gammaproteobacteria bacterium]MDA7844524.1 SRPBCC family protein [Gammaproteobacteria bacterium]